MKKSWIFWWIMSIFIRGMGKTSGLEPSNVGLGLGVQAIEVAGKGWCRWGLVFVKFQAARGPIFELWRLTGPWAWYCSRVTEMLRALVDRKMWEKKYGLDRKVWDASQSIRRLKENHVTFRHPYSALHCLTPFSQESPLMTVSATTWSYFSHNARR